MEANLFNLDKNKWFQRFVAFFSPFIISNFQIFDVMTTRKLALALFFIAMPFAVRKINKVGYYIILLSSFLIINLLFHNFQNERLLFASALYGSFISIFIAVLYFKYFYLSLNNLNYFMFSLICLLLISANFFVSQANAVIGENLRGELTGLISINSYSTYNLLAFCMCLIGVDFSEKRFSKFLFLVISGAFLIMSWILLSRQVIFASVVAICLFIGVKRSFILIAFCLIVVVNFVDDLNLLQDIFMRFEKIFDADGSTTQRFLLIDDALKAFLNNPFGYGPGASIDIPSLAISNSWRVFESWYLELVVGYGIVGVVFLVFYLYFSIEIIKSSKRSFKSLSATFMIIFLANEFGYDSSFALISTLFIIKKIHDSHFFLITARSSR